MNSGIDYLTQDEIEAHKAAMQRVVEDEKRERKDINDKKKRAIETAQKIFNEAVNSAEDESDQKMRKAKDNKEEKLAVNKKAKLAAMQRDFKRLFLLRQVYHEAPGDVFELIVSKCCQLNDDGWGLGGLNAFRLANKRLKQVVESCTTMITNELEDDGPDSLPIPTIQRCRRIERIAFSSHNLRSLEGCPNGLKRLDIGDAPISQTSPHWPLAQSWRTSG